RRPPRSPLLPYTTLFRSVCRARCLLLEPVLAHVADDVRPERDDGARAVQRVLVLARRARQEAELARFVEALENRVHRRQIVGVLDRKSTRLNSSHVSISY